jgi:hypothetical protein
VPRMGILGATVSAVAGFSVAALVTVVALLARGMRLPFGRGTVAAGLATLAVAAGVHTAHGYFGFTTCLALGAMIYPAAFFGLGGKRLLQALRAERAHLAGSPPEPA